MSQPINTAWCFVEPLDVLMLRGNRSFGAAGEHGATHLLPWPSVFAGAFRSALLASMPGAASEYGRLCAEPVVSADALKTRDDELRELLGGELYESLGTLQRPGSFRIAWMSLGRRTASGVVETLTPAPADMLVSGDTGDVCVLVPANTPPGVRTNSVLPMLAQPRGMAPPKPAAGRWLDARGLGDHVHARAPRASTDVSTLHRREVRLGIGLAADSQTVDEGALYTTEAITLADGVGFVVAIDGFETLPPQGWLRLGGDGRAARWQRLDAKTLDLAAEVPAIAPGEQFRLILTTPGLFARGWLPDGVVNDGSAGLRLRGNGFSARLACAAVPRHETVSGWDLARWAPKTAQRVAPAGSVWWFDEFEGGVDNLVAWVRGGLWPDTDSLNPEQLQRRAEGFNNALLAAWV